MMKAPEPDPSETTPPAGRRPWWRRRGLWAYALVLGASHLVQWGQGRTDPPPARAPSVEIAQTTSEGPVRDGRRMRIAYSRLDPRGEAAGDPVIVLHGSPGSRSNFLDDREGSPGLATMLARRHRVVIAPDLPGFGASTRDVADYSMRAHAHAVLGMMDALGLRRAHVVGWSQGGGVALHVADLAPRRVGSITLLSSIGVQEQEGSGSYFFEHAKYIYGYLTLVAGWDVLVPDFGLLGDWREPFIRNFHDSDQRRLRPILERLETPVLILHGRLDFLTPYETALESHMLLPRSTLVTYEDGSHFLPFSHTAPLTGQIVRHATLAERGAWAGPGEPVPRVVERRVPWWVLVLLIAPAAAARRALTTAVCLVLIARVQLDFGVAWTGIALGQLAEAAWLRIGGAGLRRRGAREGAGGGSLGRWLLRRIGWDVRTLAGDGPRRDWERRAPGSPFKAPFVARFLTDRAREAAACAGRTGISPGWFALATLAGVAVWTWLAMGPARVLLFVDSIVLSAEGFGALGAMVRVGAVLALILLLERLATWEGRVRLRAGLGRITRYEFWPWWVFYAPVALWMGVLALRHRGALVFTCCNPGIGSGGGVVGESKAQIQTDLERAGAPILAAVSIEPMEDVEVRARAAARLLDERPELGGYPVILKPDSSQRGFGVRLIRDHHELRDYLESMTRRAVMQRYHPGPHECGVLWMRVKEEGRDGLQGRIFSITRKVFQELEGDGRHTLEELVYRHPRYRCQWRVHLSRFAAQRTRVLKKGERVRLAEAGSHAQGTLFAEGSDLLTPELEARVDEFCGRFRGAGGEPIDWVRLDVRYESDESLRRGERFAIVEMNGTTAESTNIYDPSLNVFGAYRTLFRQWRRLYELGAARRAKGGCGMTVSELAGAVRRHYFNRPGPAVSD